MTNRATDTLEILRAQLRDTLSLQRGIEDTQLKFRAHNSRVADLLNEMRREVGTLARLVEVRVSRCDAAEGVRRSPDESDVRILDAENLGAVVDALCTYARYTSRRRASARLLEDQETVNLFDHIMSFIDDGVWLLDLYSNAIAIRGRVSTLPVWSRSAALRKAAS